MSEQYPNLHESSPHAVIDVSGLVDVRRQAEGFVVSIDQRIGELNDNRHAAQRDLEGWLLQLERVWQEDAAIVVEMNKAAGKVGEALGNELSELTATITMYGAQRGGKRAEMNGLTSIIGHIRSYITEQERRIAQLERTRSDAKKGLGQLALSAIIFTSIEPLEEVPARFGEVMEAAPALVIDSDVSDFIDSPVKTHSVAVPLPSQPPERVVPPKPIHAPRGLPPVAMPASFKKMFA